MSHFFGPGGTRYEQVFENKLGKVGWGKINGGFRVRLETKEAFDLDGWTRPEHGNLRYSLVVYGDEGKAAAIKLAIGCLEGVAEPEEAASICAVASSLDELAARLREIAGS